MLASEKHLPAEGWKYTVFIIKHNIMAITRGEILLALHSALLGEIYGSIRAIVFEYKPDKKYFKLRYYLDREPTEDDFENAAVTTTEFISTFKFSEFDTIEEECIYTNVPLSKIEALDGAVYLRKEDEFGNLSLDGGYA